MNLQIERKVLNKFNANSIKYLKFKCTNKNPE